MTKKQAKPNLTVPFEYPRSSFSESNTPLPFPTKVSEFSTKEHAIDDLRQEVESTTTPKTETQQPQQFSLPAPIKLPSQNNSPRHFSIPSFTGTTTFEAMRYEQHFLIRLYRSFRRNNLMLMAGGVAYSTLLSIIPLFALLFLVLTFFFEQKVAIRTLSTNLQFLVPGNSELIAKQLGYFLAHENFLADSTS